MDYLEQVLLNQPLAAQLNKQKHHIFCITSDGEHSEGQLWEAIMTANKYKLSNLINIID